VASRLSISRIIRGCPKRLPRLILKQAGREERDYDRREEKGEKRGKYVPQKGWEADGTLSI
jgi:hypothetical protein